MKTIQNLYLETTASYKWMQENLGNQEKSRFIRIAVAIAISNRKKAQAAVGRVTKLTTKKK